MPANGSEWHSLGGHVRYVYKVGVKIYRPKFTVFVTHFYDTKSF